MSKVVVLGAGISGHAAAITAYCLLPVVPIRQLTDRDLLPE